jgi:Uma2 family endonuclease
MHPRGDAFCFVFCCFAMVLSMNPAQRPATYEDLLQVPDILVAQIIDGELITSPRPASPHAHVVFSLSRVLGAFSEPLGNGVSPGGWWILFEPELHLGRDVLVPDLAGWRRERMPVLRDVPYFELMPDWVCEVLSPSTARLDRVRKMRVYAREQVRHVWLVDPSSHILEVYRRENQHWVLVSTYEDAEIARAEPFDAVELNLSRWWLTEA